RAALGRSTGWHRVGAGADEAPGRHARRHDRCDVEGRRRHHLYRSASGGVMARVLVVEDDPWSQCIVTDLLEMRGHEVMMASSVATARDALAKDPQIVLL